MIVQITPTQLKINRHGIANNLIYLGTNKWMLTFGEKTIKNIRLGRFRAVNYTCFKTLEKEHPHWKGANLLIDTEQTDVGSVMH